MKNISNILIYSCLAILFNGCLNDDGTLGQVVTFDIPKEEPRMVCAANFLDTDTVFNVLLSLSKGVNDDPYTDKMDKASVQLFKDNVLVTDFPKKTPIGSTFSFNTTNYSFINKKVLTDGEYKLNIAYSPYKPIEAIMKMPEKVNIKSAKYVPDGFVLADGDKKDEFTVEFVDPAGQNYYDFEIFYEYKDGTGLIRYDQPYDVTTSTAGSGLFSDSDRTTIFNDAIFNGKTHKLRIGVRGNSGFFDPNTGLFVSDANAIIIKFYSLSKDSYLYEKSLQEYENSQGNPFGAEPSQINTNFKNGFGMFEVRRISTLRLEL